jgi:hypothetical protein
MGDAGLVTDGAHAVTDELYRTLARRSDRNTKTAGPPGPRGPRAPICYAVSAPMPAYRLTASSQFQAFRWPS